MENRGKHSGETSVTLSTVLLGELPFADTYSAKPVVFRQFIPCFTQPFSPLKIALSPLSEHYFYPVSTGSTNTTNKEK